MSSAPQNHDPTLAHVSQAPGSSQPSGPSQGAPGSGELPGNMPLSGLGSEQVMALLKQIPGVFSNRGDLKDSAAAETLSNLSQATFAQHQAHQQHPHHPQHLQHPHHYPVHPHHPHVTLADPGPSTHPRGPPNLGQLSAAASALQSPTAPPQQGQMPMMRAHSQEGDDGMGNDDGGGDGMDGGSGGEGGADGDKPNSSGGKAGGRRGGRSATMSNDEWTRQRKDNHKEVERRRRGNINEGINELGRIVPNGSGEKAKGAILSRAVQYIHHLKENEARNIEKWTLEKLLMDQAMGDLQAQLEEMRRMWDEERIARQRLESELEVLRGVQQGLPMGAAASAASRPVGEHRSKSPDGAKDGKRDREDDMHALNGEQGGDAEDRSKRKRVE
ncbi:hypothetical protein B0H21DRAFT_760478 [Amylocystis lapponica]|nr:hypothetical protein B0H21DRAFT_760478 [Amylocystis lapponica]